MATPRRFPLAYDAFKALVALLLLLAIVLLAPTRTPPEVEVAVDPSGTVTLSGNAPRGSEVTLEVLREGRVVDRFTARADDLGRWVAARGYAPGRYTLTARSGRGPSTALDFEVPAPAALAPIAIDPLPAEPRAPLRLSGRAEPGEVLVVFVDGLAAGEVTAGPGGRWAFTLDAPAGGHTVQVAYRKAPEVAGPAVALVLEPTQEAETPAETAAAEPAKPDATDATPEPEPAEGQAYVVQEGDWLSKLAEVYLGDPMRYDEIREATNVRAAGDDRFATIEDDNLIYPGETIWIPAP
ncbi:LysM peptidoglycan-binding domain-containing protein [Oceanithermus sp.]|uniref:LysM peptidoglycan-binding domain-containing protein n=1 Tax=Oceanithermus sp. TaxID=2268145 RepID=UPI0025FF140D|nr:LysM peptidoglycan-binding domain-containing protein [Oceanithermus sp.]